MKKLLQTESSPTAPPTIDKFDAARRQIECAIRLVAAEEDELAVHTLVMAAYGILEDLAKGRPFYEDGLKPHLTKIGQTHLRGTASFLKHADRDPDGVLQPDNFHIDWRIGFCILLYEKLKGKFTPTMAAFHLWMVIRHPDKFMIAEDEDREFEKAYRQAIASLDPQANLFFLSALLRVYKEGIIPPDIGFRRRPKPDRLV